jgi:hypothetical protein
LRRRDFAYERVLRRNFLREAQRAHDIDILKAMKTGESASQEVEAGIPTRRELEGSEGAGLRKKPPREKLENRNNGVGDYLLI